MSAVGLILLAAGAATRMGTAKQLLPYRGQSLLRRAVETALATTCWPLIVVLGANAESMWAELEGLPVECVKNAAWEEGMGASIRTGMEALSTVEGGTKVESVVLMMCDQPMLTSTHLEALVMAHAMTGNTIVASDYGPTQGPPVLFPHSLFSELRRLEGGQGAKHLLHKYADRLVTVSFPEGLMDVDTPEDYERLAG